MEILLSLRYQTTRNMKSFSFDFFVPKRVLFCNPQKISCTRRECIRLLYSLLRLSDRNDESITSHHALSQAHSLEIILAATFSPIPDSVIALMKVSRPNPLFLPPTSKVIAISSVSFLSARRTDNRSYAGARRYSPMPFSSIREKFLQCMSELPVIQLNMTISQNLCTSKSGTAEEVHDYSAFTGPRHSPNNLRTSFTLSICRVFFPCSRSLTK